MGKRRRHARQKTMWVASADLPQSAGHPFYERLNRVLDAASFDAFVEAQCAKFYTDGVGRPSVAPGRYFRLLLLGYFESLDSERAIAWRAAASLSIRQFLDLELHEPPPDHSTVSRTRRLIEALVRGCGQAYALQTVEPVTYRCGTRRVCQARSSGSERDTRARPHAVAPMNCVPEDSRRRSTCTGRTHSPRALADGNQTPSSTVAVRAPSPS